MLGDAVHRKRQETYTIEKNFYPADEFPPICQCVFLCLSVFNIFLGVHLDMQCIEHSDLGFWSLSRTKKFDISSLKITFLLVGIL